MREIKIGTRNSPLALWQAYLIKFKLEALKTSCTIVPIVSSGDKNLNQPLYELGITGIFTKDLDIALLEKSIDIAVHSLKDIPTVLPKGLELSAVLERDFPQDVLVRNINAKDKHWSNLSIATSSLRRRSFWKNQFPNTNFCDIRGNVQTRLQKINNGLADATLFSLAGLKRMDMKVDYEELPFLLPAPAQGVVACVSRSNDEEIQYFLEKINHSQTQMCTQIERKFLQNMEAGCTAPIAAFASWNNGSIEFEGRIASLNGEQVLSIKENWRDVEENMGEEMAKKLLAMGADQMMIDIKKEMR